MSDNDLISRSHFDDRVRLAAGPDADEEFSADFLDGVKTVLYMLSTEPAVTGGDCVSRAWLLAEYDRQHEGPAGKARKLIKDAPAVPHEMTARELFSARDRMCNSNYDGGHMTPACKTCPLWRDNNGHDMYCGTLMTMRPLDFVAIVEKWVSEHPEERSEQ